MILYLLWVKNFDNLNKVFKKSNWVIYYYNKLFNFEMQILDNSLVVYYNNSKMKILHYNHMHYISDIVPTQYLFFTISEKIID